MSAEAQAFERHPALASWIERLANTDCLPLGDWMVFLGALNYALSAPSQPSAIDREARRLEIARIIDPECWIKVDGIISGERPVKPPAGWTREQYAHSCYREEMMASLSKADLIMGGEG